ncbi:hypothetical protein [Streptomyces sp. NPDC058683]|uniref:hypothetical protein n=1 Tax=Streptomyces sp. NPDC058683 TaxID=3346597 RepID=UPI00366567CF
MNVRQEDDLLLDGRVDPPDRAGEKTCWHLMCPSPADAFTAGCIRMEEILAHLYDLVMMPCAQDASEDYVTVAGRALVQDQLDIRAAAPPPRRRDVTGADGWVRTRAERGYMGQLATTVGRVGISRVAYRSPAPNLHVPGSSYRRRRAAGAHL